MATSMFISSRAGGWEVQDEGSVQYTQKHRGSLLFLLFKNNRIFPTCLLTYLSCMCAWRRSRMESWRQLGRVSCLFPPRVSRGLTQATRLACSGTFKDTSPSAKVRSSYKSIPPEGPTSEDHLSGKWFSSWILEGTQTSIPLCYHTADAKTAMYSVPWCSFRSHKTV